MSLEEIGAIYSSLKTCPNCKSSEGFWLGAKLNGGYVQCKHCGTILELCEVLPVGGKEGKGASGKVGILRKIKF